MTQLMNPVIAGDARSRIDSLDLLRGAAIMGILLMNTQSFSMPQMAYLNPMEYGDMGGWNRVVWMVIHVFADLKFVTIFSMLFGAGIVLQGQRIAARGGSAGKIHYKRMGVLLGLGLIHAYAFWTGDILTIYALCGMLLFPFRKIPSGRLFFWGVLLMGIPLLLEYAMVMDWRVVGFTELGQWRSRMTGNALSTHFELDAYRHGWRHQMGHRVLMSMLSQTNGLLSWSLWRCMGAMFVGMGLLKSRFFHGEWNRESYVLLAGLLIPVGWSMTGAGLMYNEGWNWEWKMMYFTGFAFNYWGSLIAATGYMALGVMVATWAMERKWLSMGLGPVRAIGKTALSNYILQTVLCTTWFFGHGFNRYGITSRVELLGVVGVVWGIQLIVSPIWTKFIGQGPLEKAWHGLVYWGLGERRHEDRKDDAGRGDCGNVLRSEPVERGEPSRSDQPSTDGHGGSGQEDQGRGGERVGDETGGAAGQPVRE